MRVKISAADHIKLSAADMTIGMRTIAPPFYLILFLLKRKSGWEFCFTIFSYSSSKQKASTLWSVSLLRRTGGAAVIIYPVFFSTLFCVIWFYAKSPKKVVSDPPFRVYEKMKQGSATNFMVTAVVYRKVPDIVSNYLLKGGWVPGKPPPKNHFPQKCLFFSDFIRKFQTFFFPETGFFPLFPS